MINAQIKRVIMPICTVHEAKMNHLTIKFARVESFVKKVYHNRKIIAFIVGGEDD